MWGHVRLRRDTFMCEVPGSSLSVVGLQSDTTGRWPIVLTSSQSSHSGRFILRGNSVSRASPVRLFNSGSPLIPVSQTSFCSNAVVSQAMLRSSHLEMHQLRQSGTQRHASRSARGSPRDSRFRFKAVMVIAIPARRAAGVLSLLTSTSACSSLP